MIELVVVMIVIGILAVFVSGRLDQTSAFDQRAVHDKLKAGLQYARKAAVAKRRYVCVSVSSGTVSFLYDSNEPENATRNCVATNYVTLPGRDRDCSGGNGNQICSKTGAAIGGGGAFNIDAQGKVASAVTFTVTGQPDIVIEAETGYVH